MDDDQDAGHPFIGYDANPNICRTCGAIWPMPCYKITPARGDEPSGDARASD